MSLKKDITALLNMNVTDAELNVMNPVEQTVRLAPFATLTMSLFKDLHGQRVDCLVLDLKHIAGVSGGPHYEIISRDYEGIIAEASDRIKSYLDDVAEAAISNIKNGYIE